MSKLVSQVPQAAATCNRVLTARAGGAEQPPCQFELAQSEQDIRLLSEMEKKMQVLRDYVVGVAPRRAHLDY